MGRRKGNARRASAAVAVLGSVILAVALSAAPAGADPGPTTPVPSARGIIGQAPAVNLYGVPGMTSEVHRLMEVQRGLDGVAERIRAVAVDTSTSGLSGISTDSARNGLRLYWHGAIPSAVAKVISDAGGEGVTVTVQPAPYTEAQLALEADRISRLPLFVGPKSGRRTMRVAPKVDGSGLQVGISGLPVGVNLDQARQLVPALDSDIPLTVTPMGPIVLAARWFDWWPWWGGAFIHNYATGYSCTNAFGVTGNNGAATYLITAAHCGEGTWQTGQVQYPDGSVQTRTFGDTISAGRSTQVDAELILTPNGSDSAVYWGSGINPDTGDIGSNNGLTVGGSTSNSPEDIVCASGSFSGTVCGAQVLATNMTVIIDPPTNGVGRITNLVWAAKLPANDLSAVVGNGDSGGPVVSVGGDGKAIARGIVSAIDSGSGYEKPCQGWRPPGRVCSYSFYFGDLRNAMNTIGVHLNTG